MILGSFPGEASLAAVQYYAYRHNQFWRLMSAVLSADLTALPYRQRLRVLLANRVGVWDIIGRCERMGSLDSNIRNAEHNDFSFLKRRAPRLKRVCFNGKTAGKLAPKLAHEGYETVVLPSSSPALTLGFEKKRELWQKALNPYAEMWQDSGRF